MQPNLALNNVLRSAGEARLSYLSGTEVSVSGAQPESCIQIFSDAAPSMDDCSDPGACLLQQPARETHPPMEVGMDFALVCVLRAAVTMWNTSDTSRAVAWESRQD
jgi:hypothetical protein